MTIPAAFLTELVGVFVDPTPIDEVMATSSVDARGVDLFPILSPLGDTVAAVTLVSVSRQDGRPVGVGDLLITPANASAPWVSVNAAGVAAIAVNWWQGVGTLAQISVDDDDVTYLLAISLTTVAGRHLIFTVSQVVSATVS